MTVNSPTGVRTVAIIVQSSASSISTAISVLVHTNKGYAISVAE